MMGRVFLAGVFSLALIGAASSAYAEVSLFASNEVRAVNVRDRLRRVMTTLKDGSESARRHSSAIAAAFKDAADWVPAAEGYYARKSDLLARAAALSAKLEAVMGLDESEVAEGLEAVCEEYEALRADYEFYMRLPRLAAGPERVVAQAAMRLLTQTGEYPASRAYYLHKTPERPPFAPLSPGVMAIRPR